jgi:hypothetical protein
MLAGSLMIEHIGVVQRSGPARGRPPRGRRQRLMASIVKIPKGDTITINMAKL